MNWAFPFNLFLVQGWVPISEAYFSYNAVSWSISTELGFYLAFPFFIHRWGETFWWKIPLAAGIVGATIYLSGRFGLPEYVPGSTEVVYHGLVYISPLGRILEFVAGIACCSIYRWLKPRVAASPLVFTVLEIAAIYAFYKTATGYFITMFAAEASGPMLSWLGHSSGLPSCMLIVIVFAFGRGYLSRPLASAPAVLLGEISFSLYLVHQIVYRAYAQHYPADQQADYVGFAICVMVSLIAAYLLWRWVEMPARAALRGVVRPIRQLAAPTAM